MVNFKVVEGDSDKEYREAFEIYESCKHYVDQGYSLVSSIKKVTDIPVTANKPIYRKVRNVFRENGYVKYHNRYIHEDFLVVTVGDLIKRLSNVDENSKVVLGNSQYISEVRNVFYNPDSDTIALVSESFTGHTKLNKYEVVK